MPTRIRESIRLYPSRHGRILSWAGAAGPAAESLLVANPPLAYALAVARDLVTQPRDTAEWAKRPYQSQRRLLGRLGFPMTEQARRIVRKIHLPSLSVDRLRALRDGMGQGARVSARLSHLGRINGAVLGIVDGPIALLTPKLLGCLSEGSDEAGAELVSLARNVYRVWRMLGVKEEAPVFGSLAGLRAFRDRIAASHTHPRRRAPSLPPPPISGTESIVPVCSINELVHEGKVQRNCVASYAARVRARKAAIYRVVAPERCTLALVPRGGRGWCLS